MSINFSLTAPIPSKKNSRLNFRTKYGKQISIPNKAYSEWHKLNLPVVKILALNSQFDSQNPFSLGVKIIFKDKRRRDLDNALNSILDLLVDGGLIPDDNWGVIQEMSIRAEKGNIDGAYICLNQ